jgi:hypothetical protein
VAALRKGDVGVLLVGTDVLDGGGSASQYYIP